MIKTFNPHRLLFTFLIAAVIISCSDSEDPGPLQESDRYYDVIDFDRIEIGSALRVEVRESSIFNIVADGDRRNLDDLEVYKRGSTLVIKYDKQGDRRHQTFIRIHMPRLRSGDFSGASNVSLRRFESDDNLELNFSGASEGQVHAEYKKVNITMSGASRVWMYGEGDEVEADLTGASVLSAFDYPVREASISASGGSFGKLTVTDDLNAVANGASEVRYRGNPTVTADVSGSSRVEQD